MRSIGIDLGSFSIKVCVVNATKKGLFLERFTEHRLVSTDPFDKNIEIIEFLRTELANEDPLQTRFVASVPQDRVSVHSKIFPFKDRLKIFRSLPFEMEDETPFNPDDTVFDGRIVRFESTQSEILACACPKEVVKTQLQLLVDSGATPHLLTPEGMGFANHFERWSEPIPTVPAIHDPQMPSELPVPPRSCHAVLNIGHQKTLLLVLEDTQLVDLRSISWGGDRIAQILQEKYNIPYSEALKQVQANSFILTNTDGATTDQIYFSGLISGAVDELIRDLRLILVEIQANANVQIHSLQMSGGVSRMQNLGPYLTQGLELPVNKYALLSHYPNTLFESNPWNNAVAGTALGLALEGLRKPRNPGVSFLRGEFAVQSHAFKNFIDVWGSTLKVAGLAVLILYIFATFRDSMAQSMVVEAEEVMKTQASNLAKLKGSKATEAGIEKFISQKRKMVREIKDVESYVAMNSALDVLKKINDAAPGRSTLRMEVQKLSIRDSQVRIEGYVSSTKETEMLQQALKNLARELKIRTVPPQNVKLPPGKVAFGLEFAVDRNVKVSKNKAQSTGSQTE